MLLQTDENEKKVLLAIYGLNFYLNYFAYYYYKHDLLFTHQFFIYNFNINILYQFTQYKRIAEQRTTGATFISDPKIKNSQSPDDTANAARPSSQIAGRSLQHWIVVENAFSVAECTQLTNSITELDATNGSLVAGRFEQDIRQSVLSWLPENDDYAWVDARITKLVADANRQLFGFALDGFDEQFQLAAYGPQQHYDWHIDSGQGRIASRRKLTLSVQLSKPDAYVGGALELNADGCPFGALRDQGTAVLFASNTLHRVTPVTRGLRHSLVAWAHGPAFV